MTRSIRTAILRGMVAATAVLLLASGPATAEGASGAPPGLAKKGGVPPGLAKKGGVPPGQAKKAWARGDRLPDDGWVVIREPRRLGLEPAGEGEIWVRIDGQAVRVARAGLQVLAAAGAVADLLN